MLDSLLTLTKGAVAWMVGGIVVCVLLDRGISAFTGLPVTFFLLIAACIFVALLVGGVHTTAKWVWHRMHFGAS